VEMRERGRKERRGDEEGKDMIRRGEEREGM
jgi:hypothetical protein